MDRYCVILDYPADMAVRRTPYRQAHLDRLRALAAGGRIELAAGFDPLDGGLLLVRAETVDEVRALVGDDPYAHAGLIEGVRIRRLAVAVP